MKKITLFSLGLVLLSFVSNAQISKGSILLGGGLSLSSSKPDNNTYKSTGFTISPSAGIAIKENKVLGLQLSYGHSNFDNNNNPGDGHSNSYGASVFLRNYLSVAKNLYLFGQGQAGFGYNKSETIESINSTNTREQLNTSISLFPGLSYALTKRFQLEVFMSNLVQAGYSSDKSTLTSGGFTTSGRSQSLSFNINANPFTDLGLGFRIILGK